MKTLITLFAAGAFVATVSSPVYAGPDGIQNPNGNAALPGYWAQRVGGKKMTSWARDNNVIGPNKPKGRPDPNLD